MTGLDVLVVAGTGVLVASLAAGAARSFGEFFVGRFGDLSVRVASGPKAALGV